jgi:hypothetical protein
MLEIAAAKTVAAGVVDRVTFARLDLLAVGEGMEQSSYHANLASHAYQHDPSFLYDKVLANFGVLNCLPDRRALAATLAQWVRPGGHLALVLMSPFCPWEIIWHLAHGQIRPALRRFRKGDKAHLGNGTTVRVWYPSPRHLCAEFAPHFRHVHAAGIGILLPPSYLRGLATRWPYFFARMARWERCLEEQFPWTWCADHYLVVLERGPVTARL